MAEHVPASPQVLLFSTSSGGYLARSNWNSTYRRAADAIGLPAVRPHELRHTGAILAAATGATTKELMRRLGHSSPAAALLYQHAPGLDPGQLAQDTRPGACPKLWLNPTSPQRMNCRTAESSAALPAAHCPAVTETVLTVLLILVGLPLLAWWIGGRRFWERARPGRERDPWGDLMRQFRLTVGEATQVTSAATRGRALDDPRLRRAVVAMAAETLQHLGPRWQSGSRVHRVVIVLGIVWLVLLVAHVVFALFFNGPSDVPWFGILTLLAVVGGPMWQRRMLHRAIEVNSDSASPADD